MHELRTADDARTRVRRLIGPGSHLPDQTRRDILDLGLAAVPALLEILTDESLALSESRGEGWAPAHATRAERGERPEDCGRDVGPKFVEYEHAGVREYWVLDPETLAHRFYRREGEILVEFASGEKVMRSEVVRGFWMEHAWLDPDHLPRIADVLARIA